MNPWFDKLPEREQEIVAYLALDPMDLDSEVIVDLPFGLSMLM